MTKKIHSTCSTFIWNYIFNVKQKSTHVKCVCMCRSTRNKSVFVVKFVLVFFRISFYFFILFYPICTKAYIIYFFIRARDCEFVHWERKRAFLYSKSLCLNLFYNRKCLFNLISTHVKCSCMYSSPCRPHNSHFNLFILN